MGIVRPVMEGFTDADEAGTIEAVDAAREHFEQDLHAQVRALRTEIGAQRQLLERRGA
jgi:hypothetical protein